MSVGKFFDPISRECVDGQKTQQDYSYFSVSIAGLVACCKTPKQPKGQPFPTLAQRKSSTSKTDGVLPVFVTATHKSKKITIDALDA